MDRELIEGNQVLQPLKSVVVEDGNILIDCRKDREVQNSPLKDKMDQKLIEGNQVLQLPKVVLVEDRNVLTGCRKDREVQTHGGEVDREALLKRKLQAQGLTEKDLQQFVDKVILQVAEDKIDEIVTEECTGHENLSDCESEEELQQEDWDSLDPTLPISQSDADLSQI
ncbi:hypothetical protein SUGI_0295480 [Cryptomeria japonica]|nr:hypothetical protein SUGI_0295480 [Cryptomeria japonica]